MTIYLAICHVHDLSWDIDHDPHHSCEHDHELLIFEDQEELPFPNMFDDTV